MPQNIECTCCNNLPVVTPEISPRSRPSEMGYVGLAKITSPTMGVYDRMLRLNDFGLGMYQDINKPIGLDGEVDKTTYRLSPRTVEGSLSLPLYVETFEKSTCPTAGNRNDILTDQIITMIWNWATTRQYGRLLNYANLDVRYSSHAAFRYIDCLVNSLDISVTQQDQINLDLDIWGRYRERIGTRESNLNGTSAEGPYLTDGLCPARALSWNDASVTGMGGCSSYIPGTALFYSNSIMSWNLNIINNLERVFTFNLPLLATDINTGIRDVTGSLELMGLSDALRDHTTGYGINSGNQIHFCEKNELRFAFYVGEDTFDPGSQEGFTSRDWTGALPVGNPLFARRLLAVVFVIEEMALENSVYRTTVNYHGMAADDESYYEFVTPTTNYYPVWF